MSHKVPSSCVIYCRVSQDREQTKAGVERQEKKCRELANRLGLTVNHVYVENDTSASYGPRLIFEEMLDAHPEAIISWHQDRLLRKTSDLEAVIPLGIPVYFVESATVDLTNPAGRATARTVAAWSQYEAEQKGLRRKAANLQRAEEGAWHFSRRPYGYERSGQTITQVLEEAEHIRSAFESYISGKSLGDIADDMNTAGATTTNGKPWTTVMISDLLSNSHYAGIVTYKGRVFPEAIPAWEPVISKETWRETRAIRKQRKQVRKPASGLPKHLLSGFLECGKCGNPMYGHYVMRRLRKDGTRADPFHVYDCMINRCVSIQADQVDNLISAAVLARLDDDRLKAALIPVADDQSLIEEIATKRERRSQIASLLAEGLLAPADARPELESLKADIEALDRRLEKQRQGSPLSDLIAAESMETRWVELSLLAKRRIMSAMGLRAVIRPTAIEDRGRVFIDPTTGKRTIDLSRIKVRWDDTTREVSEKGLRLTKTDANENGA